MKLNNRYNIITDDDVTITDENLGNSLHDVLLSNKKDIDKLKSNVKWIYKYGGVGSGSGGGGSTTKWSINATLDGKVISNGNTITLNDEQTSYQLNITISGGGNTYNVEYTYGGISKNIILSAENNWKARITVELKTNSTISITANDGLQEKTVFAEYVVKPYIFNDLVLVRDNGEEYISDTKDIRIQEAAQQGLNIVCNYSIAVNTQSASYYWEFNGETYEVSDIENKSGNLSFKVPEEILDDDNAGLYYGTLNLTIQPENQDIINIEKVVSFNLIPATLYMKILPEFGTIYDSQVEEPYSYKVNRGVALKCRLYDGPVTVKRGIINYQIDELPSQDLSVDDTKTYTINIAFNSPGWHTVTFNYSLETSSSSIVKYFYCSASQSEYDWFEGRRHSPNIRVPSLECYYRGFDNPETQGLSGISGLYCKKYTSDETTNVIFNSYESGSDLLINIGIQYSEINNVNEPILTVYGEGAVNNEICTVYQDHVLFQSLYDSNQRCNFFLHKELNYDPDDAEKYHLITIYISSVWYDSISSTVYKECAVYLDGEFEGIVQKYALGNRGVQKISLFPSNYSINHIDVSSFVTSGGNKILSDPDINYYRNTYVAKSTNNDNLISYSETETLSSLYDSEGNLQYSIENNLVKVASTLYDDIAKNLETTPTLVLTVDNAQFIRQYNISVIDWMNASYSEDSQNPAVDYTAKTTVKYGKNGQIPVRINIPTAYGSNTYFYIKLQGSSTLNNKSKNFTLGIETDNSLAVDHQTVLFSPNYNIDDTYSFLPEDKFILKADVVDSAHTNNVAMGKFINDYHSNFQKPGIGGEESIISHVKECLDGFPILLYMEIVDGDTTDVYYLGIYSFNLGRDSFFNLGYCDMNQLDPGRMENATDTTFTFTMIGGEDENGNVQRGLDPIDTFVAAEVQNNSTYWDFSQFDQTILFKQWAENSNFMFGDIKCAASNVTYRNTIQQFVRSVAFAGGYIFSRIGKEFIDANVDEGAYRIPNTVTNYLHQYKRTSAAVWSLKDETIQPADFTSLQECIGDSEGIYTPKLDYNNSVYYYLTCMAFGLVDSVQKNLNIKTWDGQTTGLFFYDMDTCLGKSNSGDKTSYFCFSDYWKSNIVEYDELGEIIDRDLFPYATAAQTINNGVTILRDYFPKQSETNIIGYDIPSSYLFAIPKYAKSAQIDAEISDLETLYSPQTLYAMWRSVGGPLETADTFIDRYYKSYLDDIPKSLINLNYRNKYAYTSTGTQHNNIVNRLYGRCIEMTRDWLNGRLHILDAYFNISGFDNIIYETGNLKIFEPITQSAGYTNNTDIEILKDIFTTSDKVPRAGTLTFEVKGLEYSPLMVLVGNSGRPFLLENPNTLYTINVPYVGNVVSLMGGSSMWTYLTDVDSFIQTQAGKTTFTYNTKRLETLIGSSGEINSSWNLNSPALRTISLTSPYYRGALELDENYYNLNTVNISGSKISLNISKSRVSEINASGVTCDSLIINQCNYLTNGNLSGATISNCQITPAWDNLSFSGSKITELTISGKDGRGRLTIDSDSNLRTITYSNYESLNINNCSALTTITCVDISQNWGILKNITITNCQSLTSLQINADNLETLNLSNCDHLTTLILQTSTNSNLSLKTLNLYNTKIKSIKYKVNNVITEDVNSLDLTKMPLLANNISSSVGGSVNLAKNTSFSVIKFANNQNNPIYLHNTFAGCTNLERIYGHVVVACTNCFESLTKFSIHGSNLSSVKWHNVNVIRNGKYLMPNEVLNKTISNYNRNTDSFYAGINITNMDFANTSLASMFRNTNCTVFDYYYVLLNIPSTVTNLSNMFYLNNNDTYGRFTWTSSVDNSPNKDMFYFCGNVTNLNSCFTSAGNYGTTYRLFSPTHTDTEVIADDGLFSPLVKCTNLNSVFGGTKYIDRFVFRRLSGDYVISNINYFGDNIVNNVNNINYSYINGILNHYQDLGDLTDFFENLPNVTSLSYFFNSSNYLNYTKIGDGSFKLPSGITNVSNIFNSTYGTGEIILSNFFVDPTNITQFNDSFKVTNANTAYGHVTMKYNSLTFADFVNLTTISGNQSSYAFSGVDKQIDGSEFPYDIFRYNTKLTTIHGVFNNANFTSAIGQDVQLPGDLLKYTPNLQDASYLFQNIAFNYTLSETGTWGPNNEIIGYANFLKCPNIHNVSYMFANSNFRLTGKIPLRFFEHGKPVIQTKTIWGADDIEWDEEEQAWIPTGYDSVELTYATYPAQITNMSGCFNHCNCDSFENLDIDNYIEDNPDCKPFKYEEITHGSGTYREITVLNPATKTFAWAYDGINRPSDYDDDPTKYDNLDEIIISDEDEADYKIAVVQKSGENFPLTADGHYMCPPDLLRYCSSNVTISSLFSGSGNGWGTDSLRYGIMGRICPYLLRPVSNITSISGLFNGCKRLSYYSEKQSDGTYINYMIPKKFFEWTPNVVNLSSTFAGTLQPSKSNLRNVFSVLKLNLTITNIFSGVYWEEDINDQGQSSYNILFQVFKSNNISNCQGAFQQPNNNSPSNPYVRFNEIFKNYTGSYYYRRTEFSNVFRGFSKLGSGSTNERFITKTLPDNTTTNNYATTW